MFLDQLVVRQRDPRRDRMAKAAAWVYWLGITVVLVGLLLPRPGGVNREAVLWLVAGAFACSLLLVAVPWRRLPFAIFYPLALAGCSQIAALVYFSGGVESPYAQLYFLIAMWAAYFFSFRGFGAVSVMIIGSALAPFLYGRSHDMSRVTSGLTQILFILLAGGLVNLLVRQVRQRNRELGRSNERLAQKMSEVINEQEKTAAVLASVADGVYVVDSNHQIALWNRAAAEITGFGSDEMVGRGCHEALTAPYPEEEKPCATLCDSVKELPPDAGAVSYEVLACRKNGRSQWLAVSAAPIRGGGAMAGIVHVFRDVSQYKEIDRMKSDFVATVSHELRTPLTSILGFSKTLLRADASFSEESRRSFLGEIVREGERLARLIEDVLSVSRIEAGRLSLELKPTGLTEAITKVIRNVSRLTSIHKFVINVGDEVPPVMADADKLHQVLLNLVVNAVNYSPEGGRVSVAAEADGEMAIVSVTDEGIGIAPEHLPHIFERFYRAGSRTPRGAAGTGLGLFVSKSLVEQMGGRIWAESEPGSGSRFYFRLPVAHAEWIQKPQRAAS